MSCSDVAQLNALTKYFSTNALQPMSIQGRTLHLLAYWMVQRTSII